MTLALPSGTRQTRYKKYMLYYYYDEENDSWEGAINDPKTDEYRWEGSAPTEDLLLDKMKSIINKHENKFGRAKRFLK